MTTPAPLARIDAALDNLLAYDFLLDEDVAWIAVTATEMDSIPGERFVCPVRDVQCIRYRGVEFRVSAWARPEHRIYPVWNLTKRTKELMTMPNHPFKKAREGAC